MGNAKSKNWIIMGAGGHSKVVIDTLNELGQTVVAVLDVKSEESGLKKYGPQDVYLAMGVGAIDVAGLEARKKLFLKFKSLGYSMPAIVHPRTHIAKEVQLFDGVQVFLGANVQVGVQIGYGTILNTGCVVEHDCNIGDFNHVAPGATICGSVKTGDLVMVGAGATIIQQETVESKTLVRAGSLFTKRQGQQP